MRYDPIFHDIPWDLIYDDNGELIGEVYLTLLDSPRKRKNKKKPPNGGPQR
jgi:hypothetical protein